MDHRLFSPFCLLALASTAVGQVPLSWSANSGQLPSDVVPAWSSEFGHGGACSQASAILAGGILTVDTLACPGDIGSYGQLFLNIGGGSPLPTTYWFEADLRIVSSLQQSIDDGPATVVLGIVNSCGWRVDIDDGEVALWYDQQLVGSATADTATAMHEYRAEVDAATGFARVFLDGSQIIAGPQPPSMCAIPAIFAHSVGWGDLSGNEGGVVEWSAVRHNFGTGEQEFCQPAGLNSTGLAAALGSNRNRSLALNDFSLTGRWLPPNAFGFFLVSRGHTAQVPLAGSQGSLCLAGPVGRLTGPGQIINATAAGTATLGIDLGAMPQGSGHVAVQPGESWHFQLWYRDSNPAPTSNLSAALQVIFE